MLQSQRQPPKLLEQVHQAIRLRHYSLALKRVISAGFSASLSFTASVIRVAWAVRKCDNSCRIWLLRVMLGLTPCAGRLDGACPGPEPRCLRQATLPKTSCTLSNTFAPRCPGLACARRPGEGEGEAPCSASYAWSPRPPTVPRPRWGSSRPCALAG